MSHYAPIREAATGPTDRDAALTALVAIWLDTDRTLSERRAALDAADNLAIELARGEYR